MKKEWKVGDKYKVIHDGKILLGEIIKIDSDGYHVKWSGWLEEVTIEDYPSPYKDNY